MFASRPRLKKFLSATARYGIFFILGLMTSNYIISSTGVPLGVYVPMHAGEGASFQLNATNVKQEGDTLTLWIREDRNGAFIAESGIAGHTIISQVELVCGKSPTIAIIEQRSFSNSGQQTGRWVGRDPTNDSSSLMSFVTIVKVCGIQPSGGTSRPEPKKNQPTFIA